MPGSNEPGIHFLATSKFKILEFQFIAHIYSIGQQCDGDLGDHAGLIVFDKSVIAADIDNGTDHNITF